MGVENHTERARVCGRNRRPQRFIGRQLFADALVNQHIGIHRHTDAEYNAGNARQRERELEHGQHAHRNQDIQDQGRIGDHAREQVVNCHERDDRDRAI